MPRQRSRMKRSGFAWTDEEDALLLEMKGENYSDREIGRLLERSSKAVERRWMTLRPKEMEMVKTVAMRDPHAGCMKPIRLLSISPRLPSGEKSYLPLDRRDGIPRVYLAGKIGKNDWRSELLEIRNADDFCDRNFLDEAETRQTLLPHYEWPVYEDALPFGYDYTGPFFTSCDHGCSHLPTSHAFTTEGPCNTLGVPRSDHSIIFRLCVRAILRSDVIFAWIDREDCHGTLVELGIAVANSIPVFVAGTRKFPELWFAYETAARSQGGLNPSLNRCLFGFSSAADAFMECAPLMAGYATDLARSKRR